MESCDPGPNPSETPPPLHLIDSPARPPQLPWGFWATTGLGLALVATYIFAQAVVASIFVLVEAFHRGGKAGLDLDAISTSGDVLAWATIFGAALVWMVGLLFIHLRKGPTTADYLGLRWPKLSSVAIWSTALATLIIASEALTFSLNRPIIPEVMVATYGGTSFRPALWVALMIAGPMNEEFIFRAFLFRGWKDSRLGNWGTVLLTAAFWASIHMQYDLYGISSIFVIGILLGLVRWKTGSMSLCVVLHGLMNLIATIETEYVLRGR